MQLGARQIISQAPLITQAFQHTPSSFIFQVFQIAVSPVTYRELTSQHPIHTCRYDELGEAHEKESIDYLSEPCHKAIAQPAHQLGALQVLSFRS